MFLGLTSDVVPMAVRLDQIANVIDNVEDNKNASWLYTKAGARRAINLQVMRSRST
jgi:hypothetical protein